MGDGHIPGKDEVIVLPLGGCEQFGMNMTLYGHAGRWIMLDCGLGFAGDDLPGVDIIVPDPAFIAERAHLLDGLVITHAHEDHLGAVAALWPKLKCPVYATPFTAHLLRGKLVDRGLLAAVPITILPMSGTAKIGVFDIELVTITHSIPEPNVVALRTPIGTIMHTGDWKLDPTPLVGEVTDQKRLMEIGQEGVLLAVCDSTNALVEGTSGSEADVLESLTRLFQTIEGDRRIIVTCFASNVARLHAIAEAARSVGRDVALVGRSLHKIVDAAHATGVLPESLQFLDDKEAGYLPRGKVVYIATGSQGEDRAALPKLASNAHPELKLTPGDVVIFSSRTIPGNERSVLDLENSLIEQGMVVHDRMDSDVHVSGHPCRDELAEMYRWLKPKIVLAVHGERRHTTANAELARECQVPMAFAPKNGEMMRVTADGHLETIAHIPTGILAQDGERLLASGGDTFRQRRKLALEGVVAVSVSLDHKGRVLARPQVTLLGLDEADAAQDFAMRLSDIVSQAIEGSDAMVRRDNDLVKDKIRLTLRQSLKRMIGKKPQMILQISRV